MRMRVLVVCHGNKWRSPLAAELLARVQPNWDIVSAGAGSVAGEGHPWAVPVRERLKVPVSAHRSRMVTREMLGWADMIIYMDSGNRRRLIEMGAEPDKLRCLATETPTIRDPAFTRRNSPEMKAIFDQIEREVARL